MMTTSGDTPKHDSDDLSDDQFDKVVRDVLRSFVPTETTIDGGLLPSRLSDDPSSSNQAVAIFAPPSTPTEATAAVRQELNRVFGDVVRPIRRLGRAR
jgi:hypothetical protein